MTERHEVPQHQAFTFGRYQGSHYVVYPEGFTSGLMSRATANENASIFNGEVHRLPRPTRKRWGRIILMATTLSLMAWAVAQAENFRPLTRSEPVVRMVLQEASGEPHKGQITVAGVAFDRMADGRWPRTMHAVIYQPWQFTGMRARLGKYTTTEIERAREAVAAARMETRPCGTVLWYHAEKVNPDWSKRVQRSCQIGNHIFYGDPR